MLRSKDVAISRQFKRLVRVLDHAGNSAKAFVSREIVFTPLNSQWTGLILNLDGIRSCTDGGIPVIVDGSIKGSGVLDELDDQHSIFWKKLIEIKIHETTGALYTDPTLNHIEFVFVGRDGVVHVWNLCLVIQAEKKGGACNMYAVSEKVFAGQVYSTDGVTLGIASIWPFNFAVDSKFWTHRNKLQVEVLAIYKDAMQKAGLALPNSLELSAGLEESVGVILSPKKIHARVVWVAPHYNLFGLKILNGVYVGREAVTPFFQIQSNSAEYRGLSVGQLVTVNGHGNRDPIVEKEDGNLCANGVRVIS